MTINATAGLRLQGGALFGFVERQKNLYKRYWAWEVVWFVYSLVGVLSIGYLASGLQALGAQSSRFDVHAAQVYLLAGALLWGYLSLVFMEVSAAIAWERWEGTIEYTFMAPVRRVTHLLGICTFAVLYGTVRSALVALAVVAMFHLDLTHADLGSALVVLVASTVPLVGLGIFTSILPLLSPEKGEQMTFAVQGIVLLCSGVYYPVSVLPAPLRALGSASPLTYTLQGVRACLLQGRHVGDELGVIGLLLGMGAVLIPAGLAVFALAERRAKRLGLLKRSG
jgi:ABC-2 type transport system permease protein